MGINVDTPNEALSVAGNLNLTGQLLQPSDARLKEDIVPVSALYMRYCTWDFVHGILYMGCFTCHTVHEILYMGYCTWDTVHGIQYMGYCTWDTVHGILYMAYSILEL